MMKMPNQKFLTILLVLMLVLLIVGNSLLTAQPRLYNYCWRCQAPSNLARSKATLTKELNFLDKNRHFLVLKKTIFAPSLFL